MYLRKCKEFPHLQFLMHTFNEYRTFLLWHNSSINERNKTNISLGATVSGLFQRNQTESVDGGNYLYKTLHGDHSGRFFNFTYIRHSLSFYHKKDLF